MLIYLDMCSLKRPFDDQTQPRIHLESEAVLAVLAMESEWVQFVRSPALILENSYNPVKDRAARVQEWLAAAPLQPLVYEPLAQRLEELMRLGFKSFDAAHLACAEQAKADVFVSCDDKLLAASKRHAAQLKVRVIALLELPKEVVT